MPLCNRMLTSRLPVVLREFTRIHRAVDPQLTVGPSGGVIASARRRELDLVPAKRFRCPERARISWGESHAGSGSGGGTKLIAFGTSAGEGRAGWRGRKSLVWVSSDPLFAEPNRPLPLISLPTAELQPGDRKKGRAQLAHRMQRQQLPWPQFSAADRARDRGPGRWLCAGEP